MMTDKYEEMLQIAIELDRRDNNNLISQVEILGTLYENLHLLTEEEEKRYYRMCEKVKYLQILEGDDLVFLKCWENRLRELENK